LAAIDLKMKLTGIIFDMDGTLLDSERVSAEAWARTREAIGEGLPENFAESVIGFATHRCRARMVELLGSESAMEAHWNYFTKAYDDLVEGGAVELKSGAREILVWARECNLRLALATSTRREVADRKLAQKGFSEFFEIVVCGDDVSESKPHPEIFLTVQEKLGIDKDLLIAIEDSPNGLRSAVSAGLRTVLVPDLARLSSDDRALAWKEFSDLTSLQAWLASQL
jgi:HAD superfamily hydrolase (TIGR01509 family)|tara:strand:+ start:213787 stop:214464 length:678 start_codon:yes stop_codon:yes gene_type:complete